MIVKLIMYAKIFVKICLRAVRDTFFYNIWSAIRGGIGEINLLMGVMSNRKGAKFGLLGLQGDPPIPSLSGTSWSPHKENPEEGAWSAYCNDLGMSE